MSMSKLIEFDSTFFFLFFIYLFLFPSLQRFLSFLYRLTEATHNKILRHLKEENKEKKQKQKQK